MVGRRRIAALYDPTAFLLFFWFFSIFAYILETRVDAFVPYENGRLRASVKKKLLMPVVRPLRLEADNESVKTHDPPLNDAPLRRQSTSEILTQFARDLRRLSVLRPAVPGADFSAPPNMNSAVGSSYTRIWTPETWRRHTLSYPHERYFRHLWYWRFSTTAQKVFPSVLFAAVWASVVSITVQAYPGSFLINTTKGASAALRALSAPLALLLTLRTNAALERLNETRLAMGKVVLSSRSFTALLRTYVLPVHPEAAILAARHVAIFPWLLKSSLRGEDRTRELEVMETVLGKSQDYKWLASHPRPVWGVTVRLRQIVEAVAGCSGVFYIPHNLLEEEIAKLEGAAGVCERILASPIPPTYSRHLSRVLTIFLAMLPIGLVGSGIPTVGTIFASAFMSYTLVGIDEIGMEIEHPFSLLPMQQLAAAAQKGVGMQLIDHECSEGSIDDDDITSQMPQVPL